LLAILSLAGQYGVQGEIITGEEVRFHKNGETYMVFPAGMTYERAIEILKAKQKEENTVVSFQRIFRFRPDDGANAAAEVLKRRYGLTIGKSTQTMFGEHPPVIRTIAVGPNKTKQVPWGKISIPALKGADIQLTATHDEDYGPVFAVVVQSPKKHKPEIEKLFDEIEQELRDHSIYRGKALVGADQLEFLDVSKFDASKIVFSDEVTATLNAGLFGALDYADEFRADGIPLKRALLLYGPYGTGKSSVGNMTAQVAERNGWTFLMARSGKDKIKDVLRTAKLYQPAVVFVEDIDAQSATSKPQEVSELLESFDGITAKGTEIILVMTTNHVDLIHAGMMRPGRLDFVVKIGALDRNGTERLIRAVVASHKLDASVDFDAVYDQMDGFEPAFVKATADRAKTFALTRNQGKPDYVLMTEDLVNAAQSLHPQLELLRAATEGIPEPEIETALSKLFDDRLGKVEVRDSDDDVMYTLAMAEAV
jgi:transitional endoplasmic reticulum ATPase